MESEHMQGLEEKTEIQLLADKWFRSISLVNKPRIAKCKLSDVLKFIQSQEIIKPTDITSFAIQDYINDILVPKYRKSSCRTIITSITNFCHWLEDNDLVLKNPCRGIKRPRVEDDEVRYLNDEEIQQLFAWAKYFGYMFEIEFFYYTGMRHTEVRQSRWGWIDLKEKVIRIPAKCCKSNRARTIPLPDKLLETMQVVKGGPQELIFPGQYGKMRSEKAWYHYAHKLRKNVPGFYGWHCLRHTYATASLQRNMPLSKVSHRLGHKNFNVTLKYYANFERQAYDPEVNRL